MGLQAGREFGAFLGWVVHHQHAVHAGRCRVAHKAAGAMALVVAFHRVGVTHQHHRGGLVALAEGLHHVQHLGHANAQRQRAFTGLLDHRAVGHGVGERHAEFDHVGTGLDHAVHQVGGDVGKREARRDVGDQRLAALGLEGIESGLDTSHVYAPLTT